jgi:HK97 family phage prohead protease
MSKQKIEYKSFSFKVEGVDEKGTIRGYASTFGNVDLGMDVVDKGAFRQSIKSGTKWPILKQHDPDQLLGFNVRGEEDDHGLYVEGKLNLDVQAAREQYSLAKQALELGANFGLSIGYMPIKAEPDRKNPIIRRLKEIKLFEYSLVTFPMNEEAMITAAKSLVGVDRINYLIEQFKKQGVPDSELALALRSFGAAPESKNDPNRLIQSMDSLIASMRDQN